MDQIVGLPVPCSSHLIAAAAKPSSLPPHAMSTPPSSPDPLALTARPRITTSRKRKREADSPSPTTERRPKVDQARRSPKHVRFAPEGVENDPDPDEYVAVSGDESKVLREVMRGRSRPAVARGRGGGRGGKGELASVPFGSWKDGQGGRMADKIRIGRR